MTLYGCHNGNFSYIHEIQEMNKIKFIEIMKNMIQLSKVIIINLPIMEKLNQNHG